MDNYLSKHTFEKLFPFHIVINENCEMIKVGRSMQKHLPDLMILGFFDLFKIKRPFSAKPNFESIIKYQNQIFVLEFLPKNILFKGQLIKEENDNNAIFLLTPWLTNVEQLETSGILITDFAMHDSVPDLLQVLKNQDLSLLDYKLLSEKLKLAKDEAEENQRVKSQFLANMSHEIRTPINGILGLADFLLQKQLDKETHDYVGIIQNSGELLLHIVNDILDFSKIEADKIVFESIAFNLNDELAKLFKSLSFIANKNHNTLDYEIAPNTPELISCDLGKLQQILSNLISNASKFTKDGYIDVAISSSILSENKGILQISVKDTGIGIPEDKIDTIFQSFTQENATTSRKYGGTGLGLTITKRLIELQGGSLKVQSRVGVGSDFTFSIPFDVVNKIQENNNLDFDIEKVCFNQQKILLVDDNKINLLVAKLLLVHWNLEVDEANNGLVALELVKNNHYDLILMDMQMPEMDGLEATKLIRLMNNDVKNIPIIAMTANVLEEEKNKCFDAGMNDYISKPFNKIEFAKILQLYLI